MHKPIHRRGVSVCSERRRTRERGQSFVEVAWTAPIVLLCLLGLFDFSRAFYLEIQLANAAHEAAHYYSLHPDATNTDLETVAVNAAPVLEQVMVETQPIRPYQTTDGDVASIKIYYTFHGLILGNDTFGKGFTMGAQAAMPVVAHPEPQS